MRIFVLEEEEVRKCGAELKSFSENFPPSYVAYA